MFIEEILALKSHSGEKLIVIEVKLIYVSYFELEENGETVDLELECRPANSTGTGRTITRTR